MRNKSKVSGIIYIGVALLLLFLLLGHEFFWRFDPKLELTTHLKIRNANLQERQITIEQRSDSPIDTTRRDFKNIRHAKTDVSIWLQGSRDTIHTSLEGRYFSEFRRIHISSDSSTQIILLPNTTQGLPTGWTTVVYFRNDSLSISESANYYISDIDNDGNEEVNIPEKGGWMKLNTSNGKWIPAQLKSVRITP